MAAAVHALHAPARDRAEAVARLGSVASPRERSFDRVVELAARICEAPLATRSFVNGDRLWVKASHGTDLRELLLEGAFCRRWPVFEGRPCLLPDTLASERYRDPPFVVDEPRVRSCAGVSVFASDGVSIGSLCVMDPRPRPLTDEQLGALEGLSEQVTALLLAYRQASEPAGAPDENERLVDRLVERTHRLQEVQRIAAVSAWSLHLPDEVLEVPEGTWQLYELDPQGCPRPVRPASCTAPPRTSRSRCDSTRSCSRRTSSRPWAASPGAWPTTSTTCCRPSTGGSTSSRTACRRMTGCSPRCRMRPIAACGWSGVCCCSRAATCTSVPSRTSVRSSSRLWAWCARCCRSRSSSRSCAVRTARAWPSIRCSSNRWC